MNTGNRVRDGALEQLLAACPVVLYTLPAYGDRSRLSWVSSSVTARFGYTPEQCLLPHWWYERVHPLDRLAARGQWPALRWAERVVSEYRFQCADGSYRWLRDEMRRTGEVDGDAVLCVGAWTDIHQARLAEQDRAAAEAQYLGLAEAAPHGILIHQGGRIVYANPAGLQLLGFASLEAIVGQPSTHCVTPADAPALRDQLACCRRGEAAPAHTGWEALRSDGSRIWLDWVSMPFAWHGEPAVVSFLSDLTQRKRLEAQCLQAQKADAVSQLAGGVAHDFSNLLTVLNGYSDLLLQSLGPRDPHRRVVEEMRRTGDRAAALTRQLLVLSRKQEAARHVLDPNAVITDLENLLHRFIGEPIHLTLALRSTRPVLADPGQLDQVLLNLALNARDAMPAGGTLTIATDDVELAPLPAQAENGAAAKGIAENGVAENGVAENGVAKNGVAKNGVAENGVAENGVADAVQPGVRLTVRDTGCGMTSAVQARLFEPFFTTKGPTHGSGLGLATVQRIVQQFGGRIRVASAPQQGTTFQIDLPMALEAAAVHGTAPAENGPPRRGSETVLVVEDETSVRTLIQQLLTDSGYHVLEAPDGSVALTICEQQTEPIHLLVTDVVMPVLGGPALAEAARRRQPGLRVLFVSGYADEALSRQNVQLELVHFLQKPFTASALIRKVREVLDA